MKINILLGCLVIIAYKYLVIRESNGLFTLFTKTTKVTDASSTLQLIDLISINSINRY